MLSLSNNHINRKGRWGSRRGTQRSTPRANSAPSAKTSASLGGSILVTHSLKLRQHLLNPLSLRRRQLLCSVAHAIVGLGDGQGFAHSHQRREFERRLMRRTFSAALFQQRSQPFVEINA